MRNVNCRWPQFWVKIERIARRNCGRRNRDNQACEIREEVVKPAKAYSQPPRFEKSGPARISRIGEYCNPSTTAGFSI
jgi:hypothetical protein